MKKATIILIMAIVLGLCYGWISALRNQNPHYPPVGSARLDPKAETGLAWSWSPNPLWLPSFALCKAPRNGFGITHTKSGYLFRSESGRKLYFVGSTITGGIIGCLVGCVVLLVMRKKKVSVESGPCD